MPAGRGTPRTPPSGCTSSITVDFCPRCRRRLPASQRDRWFDELGRRGIDPGRTKSQPSSRTTVGSQPCLGTDETREPWRGRSAVCRVPRPGARAGPICRHGGSAGASRSSPIGLPPSPEGG
ncbi:DUF6980 family protein [Streptomyces sp. NPDC055005]